MSPALASVEDRHIVPEKEAGIDVGSREWAVSRWLVPRSRGAMPAPVAPTGVLDAGPSPA